MARERAPQNCVLVKVGEGSAADAAAYTGLPIDRETGSRGGATFGPGRNDLNYIAGNGRFSKRPATRVHQVAPDCGVIYTFTKLDPQSPNIKNRRNLVHAFLR